jgi:hypothetical protein
MQGEPKEREGLERTVYTLRLYIDGKGSNSAAAQASAQRLLDRLKGAFAFELIDVLQSPDAAKEAHLPLVPALVVNLGGNRRIFYGRLSDTEEILREIEWMRDA